MRIGPDVLAVECMTVDKMTVEVVMVDDVEADNMSLERGRVLQRFESQTGQAIEGHMCLHGRPFLR